MLHQIKDVSWRSGTYERNLCEKERHQEGTRLSARTIYVCDHRISPHGLRSVALRHIYEHLPCPRDVHGLNCEISKTWQHGYVVIICPPSSLTTLIHTQLLPPPATSVRRLRIVFHCLTNGWHQPLVHSGLPGMSPKQLIRSSKQGESSNG